LQFSFLDPLFGSLDGVDAGNIVPEVLLGDLLQTLILLRRIVKGPRQAITQNGHKILIDLFGILRVFLILNMVDKELQVVQKQILIVDRGVEIGFE
jgi:hypothetical protein